MKKRSFKFEPDAWMGNRALRACSPAARGFWVDLLCLCHPSGYLTVNDKPISDTQLSSITGQPVAKIRQWIKELGEAGIYGVTDDGLLFSSKMIDETKHRDKMAVTKIELSKPDIFIKNPVPHRYKKAETFVGLDEKILSAVHPKHAKVAPKKALDWWQSKAGWVRQGASQAISIGAEEAFEDFQCRVAAKIPPGRHMDALTPGQLRQVEAMIPKDPAAKA